MDWESLSTTEHDPLALAHASPEPQMILTQTGPILGHLTKNPCNQEGAGAVQRWLLSGRLKQQQVKDVPCCPWSKSSTRTSGVTEMLDPGSIRFSFLSSTFIGQRNKPTQSVCADPSQQGLQFVLLLTAANRNKSDQPERFKKKSKLKVNQEPVVTSSK